MVADLDAADVGADRLDDPRALVAEHVREHLGGQEALEVDVGVAQARGDDADQHLVGPGAVELDLVEDEVPALLVDDGDGGPHDSRSSQK